MSKEATVKEVTAQELVSAFEGKHVSISPTDHYGISINMYHATLEYEEESNELWFVSRDNEDKIISSICIDEDSIENIEVYDDGTYTVNFLLNMTSVDISESAV